MFESFTAYQKWYTRQSLRSQVSTLKSAKRTLDSESTIGLLLMRPQVVSKATKHYDELIRAIESEGLSVIPVLTTLMDNREACERFFLDDGRRPIDARSKEQRAKGKANDNGLRTTDDHRPSSIVHGQPRVSQIVSLTGFSFVGGPAMNDSEAAAEFLRDLNRPYHSAVSL